MRAPSSEGFAWNSLFPSALISPSTVNGGPSITALVTVNLCSIVSTCQVARHSLHAMLLSYFQFDTTKSTGEVDLSSCARLVKCYCQSCHAAPRVCPLNPKPLNSDGDDTCWPWYARLLNGWISRRRHDHATDNFVLP